MNFHIQSRNVKTVKVRDSDREGRLEMMDRVNGKSECTLTHTHTSTYVNAKHVNQKGYNESKAVNATCNYSVCTNKSMIKHEAYIDR